MVPSDSNLARTAPALLLVFGLGWLVGAEAAWYWGGIAVAAAIYWQYKNSDDRTRPVGSVRDVSDPGDKHDDSTRQ